MQNPDSTLFSAQHWDDITSLLERLNVIPMQGLGDYLKQLEPVATHHGELSNRDLQPGPDGIELINRKQLPQLDHRADQLLSLSPGIRLK